MTNKSYELNSFDYIEFCGHIKYILPSFKGECHYILISRSLLHVTLSHTEYMNYKIETSNYTSICTSWQYSFDLRSHIMFLKSFSVIIIIQIFIRSGFLHFRINSRISQV